jgi:hypothetical protein
MDNIRNVMVTDRFLGEVEFIVISNPDGSETSMPKSMYDTLPSESSIPTTPQAGA